jgi:hypothetical protein
MLWSLVKKSDGNDEDEHESVVETGYLLEAIAVGNSFLRYT